MPKPSPAQQSTSETVTMNYLNWIECSFQDGFISSDEIMDLARLVTAKAGLIDLKQFWDGIDFLRKKINQS